MHVSFGIVHRDRDLQLQKACIPSNHPYFGGTVPIFMLIFLRSLFYGLIPIKKYYFVSKLNYGYPLFKNPTFFKDFVPILDFDRLGCILWHICALQNYLLSAPQRAYYNCMHERRKNSQLGQKLHHVLLAMYHSLLLFFQRKLVNNFTSLRTSVGCGISWVDIFATRSIFATRASSS